MITSSLKVLYNSFLNTPAVTSQLEPKRQSFIAMPWHMDLNLHLNNAKYLSFCNQARLVYISEYKMLNILLVERIRPLIYKNEVAYFKSINLFSRFAIETSLQEVKKESMIFKHVFLEKDIKMAEVISHIKLKKKEGNIDHAEFYHKYFHP